MLLLFVILVSVLKKIKIHRDVVSLAEGFLQSLVLFVGVREEVVLCGEVHF
jgi:hypothetical protein